MSWQRRNLKIDHGREMVFISASRLHESIIDRTYPFTLDDILGEFILKLFHMVTNVVERNTSDAHTPWGVLGISEDAYQAIMKSGEPIDLHHYNLAAGTIIARANAALRRGPNYTPTHVKDSTDV